MYSFSEGRFLEFLKSELKDWNFQYSSDSRTVTFEYVQKNVTVREIAT